MAKTTVDTQPYLVVKQTKAFSRNTGRPYTKITLVGIKDQREYETYVEEGMRNYKHWEHIVAYPDRTFVLTNLTVKNSEDGLISADSRPVIEHSALPENSHEIIGPITEYWEEENRRGSATTFNQLFSVGK